MAVLSDYQQLRWNMVAACSKHANKDIANVNTVDEAEALWGKGHFLVAEFKSLTGLSHWIRTPAQRAWASLPSTRPIRGPLLCRSHEDCKAHPSVAHACWEKQREERAK